MGKEKEGEKNLKKILLLAVPNLKQKNTVILHYISGKNHIVRIVRFSEEVDHRKGVN